MNPASPFALAPPKPSSAHTASRQPCSEPTVLQCASTADLLAALPLVSGLTAENSLFVIVFDGRRASEVLRVDLPVPGDAPATRSFLISLRGLLRASGAGARGAAIVITSAAGFEECGRAPWLDLARQIEHLFVSRRWPLRDLAVLAPDGWAGLLGERIGERRSLDDISTSPVARSAAALGRAPQALNDLTALPAPEPSRSARIAAELQLLDAEVVVDRAGSASIAELADLAEACLGVDVEPPLEPALCARLIRATESRRGWIVVAHTVLTRAAFVTELFESPLACRLFEEPSAAPETSTRLASDLREPALHEWLIAIGEERPEERRLACAIAALTEIVAHTPAKRRAGMLGLLAWMWWLRGMQSVSQHFAELALESDAGSSVARAIRQVHQAPPAWCLRLLREGRRR